MIYHLIEGDYGRFRMFDTGPLELIECGTVITLGDNIMREIWTLNKPIVITFTRQDTSTYNARCNALRVDDVIGYPENGLQRIMVSGAIAVDASRDEVWDLDQRDPKKAVLMEINVRNIHGKSRAS